MKTPVCLSAFLTILSACGGNGDTNDGAVPVTEDTLTVTDTVGVLMGDSCYMFGSIVSAEALPGGGAVLMDRRTGLISTFDGNGEFISSFGGLGEAPGEFNLPGSMTLLGDGRIAAMDWRDMEVCFFDLTGEYLGCRGNMGSEMPLSMSAAGDSCFITYSCPSRQMEDTWQMGYELSVWEGTSDEPRSIPFRHLFQFGEEEFDFRPGYIAMAGGSDERLYIHRMNSDQYVIEILDLDGNPVDSIVGESSEADWEDMDRYPYMPVAIFAVQIDDEMQQLQGDLTEAPPQVERLGVDSTGNIWARRGNDPGFEWDVFSSDGVLLKRVTMTALPDTSMVVVNVNRFGAVAYDLGPEDYPKVYLLSFGDEE